MSIYNYLVVGGFAATDGASTVQDVAVRREPEPLARHSLRQHLGGPRVRVGPAASSLLLRPLRRRVAHGHPASVHHPATQPGTVTLSTHMELKVDYNQ